MIGKLFGQKCKNLVGEHSQVIIGNNRIIDEYYYHNKSASTGPAALRHEVAVTTDARLDP